MSKKSPINITNFSFNEHPNVSHYDWRLSVVTTVAEAFRSPAGHVHEPGTPIVAICPVEYDRRTLLRYNMPSVCALLLSYAHRLYLESKNILHLFTADCGGGYKTVQTDGPLMELLERRMAIVVFSYTAIEAFANEVIEEAFTKKNFSYSEQSIDSGVPYTLNEIERFMSLETKLCGVLPEITKVKSPKGTLQWQRYAQLKKFAISSSILNCLIVYKVHLRRKCSGKCSPTKPFEILRRRQRL